MNALIARHPDFATVRSRIRTALADSTVSLDMSVPLDALPLPKLKGRWFNGRADFGFSYTLNQFNFEVKSAEGGGHRFPESFSQGFGSSFTRSFNTEFHDSLGKNPEETKFWSRIKRIDVEGDKLVMTTQPSGSRDRI